MNIDVLSFDRLAHRVFEETGGEYRKILEDTGKNLILRRLAEEKKGELTLLGGNLRKLGYISEVKSLLSEFVQYRITPEDLTQMMERNQDNPQLYYKLKDMNVIYESFQEYLKEEYLTCLLYTSYGSIYGSDSCGVCTRRRDDGLYEKADRASGYITGGFISLWKTRCF